MSEPGARVFLSSRWKDQPSTLDFSVCIPINEIILQREGNIVEDVEFEGIHYQISISNLGRSDAKAQATT